MTNSDIKLAYVPSTLCIRATIPMDLVKLMENPPASVLSRAKAKLDSEVKLKKLSSYLFLKEEFEKVWSAARESTDSEKKSFTVTLAYGIPKLIGVALAKGDGAKVACYLSLGSGETAKKCRYEWIAAAVAKTTGLALNRINQSQIASALAKAARSEVVRKYPISIVNPSSGSKKPYTFSFNKARKELVLNIFSPSYVLKNDVEVFTALDEASRRISVQLGDTYEILDEVVEGSIRGALSSPAQFGLMLPYSSIGAVAFKHRPKQESKKQDEDSEENSAQTQVKKVKTSEGLSVEISEDGMSAYIIKFDMELYKTDVLNAGKSWLINLLNRMGLQKDKYEASLPYLVEAMNQKQDITGMQVGVGDPGTGGLKPYIHDSYKQAFASKVNLETDNLDIRGSQQRNLVKENQLIAEIRYKTPPRMGTDVLGNRTNPTDNEDFVVHIGDGVEERKPGKFYACFDGMPTIKRNKIQLNRILIHDGDVNLKSGDINFDGPVEIRGNVDNGASVKATGDILIVGNINVANVVSGGNIVVNGGVVTSHDGSVFAHGNIKANFIENSVVRCGKNLQIHKAILNSMVISGGKIEVKDKSSGVIAGGTLSCFEMMQTGKLGFKVGNHTILKLGVDWKSELSCEIRRNRIETLESVQASDRAALREVMDRQKKKVKGKKNDEQKAFYQKRLQRIRAVIEKCEAHLKEAEARINFNTDAHVLVHQSAYPSLTITIAGAGVKMPMEMAHIAIVGRRSAKGSNVMAMEDFLERKEDFVDDGLDEELDDFGAA